MIGRFEWLRRVLAALAWMTGACVGAWSQPLVLDSPTPPAFTACHGTSGPSPFYNRSMFAKYGIDPQSIVTWDDYVDAGVKILQKSGGKTKMLCLPRGMLVELFEPLLQQAGGQIFDKDAAPGTIMAQ